ncbi:7150_t:CDS:1 [Ambispora gerdemannii]|uniref:7150_t:CDS:1 n=1 Tax=Ambispora gerdemannii TaxID=144530 RepID=A0A9N9GUY9_9GLOM|nr:7150_t:CDS:1 [Ambispora gerdemannii]
MAQPYRIQDSRSSKRNQPQIIQDNNTGVARNRFSRKNNRISCNVPLHTQASLLPTINSKNSGRRDVISSSVEGGETLIENRDPASPFEVIELSGSEEENNEPIQIENSNNPPPQNDIQNFVQRIYIDLVDDSEEDEEKVFNNEGETSTNNRESLIEVIELSDSEEERSEQIQPENSNNSTLNDAQRIYIDLVDDNEEDEEEEKEGQIETIYISDPASTDYDEEEGEELDYDDIEPNFLANQAEILRRIHLYGQIRPQTEEERESLSPPPREGFTTDLDKDTVVICSRCDHGMESGMCALYCGHVVCGDCGTLYENFMTSFCRVCKEYTALDEVTRLFF